MNDCRLNSAVRAVVVGFALCGAALSTAAENGAKAVARAPVVPLDREAMKKATVAKEFTAKDGFKLGYRLHLPAETKERPLVVMMRGLGEIGNDNFGQLALGAPQLLGYITEKGHEAVFLAPQCPTGHTWMECKPWTQPAPWKSTEKAARPIEAVIELIESVANEYHVNRARIYVTGMSMGGFATWELILRKPGLFAGAVPVCGGGDPAMAEKLLRVPIWTTHNMRDPAVKAAFSRATVAAFWTLNAKNIRYTEYWKEGHDAWTETYSDREILDWLFSQRRW